LPRAQLDSEQVEEIKVSPTLEVHEDDSVIKVEFNFNPRPLVEYSYKPKYTRASTFLDKVVLI